MNIEKEKTIDIMFVGPGMDEFEPIRNEYTKVFEEKGFHFHFGMGFAAPDVTNIMINIGSGVISGVSVFLICELIKKMFNRKQEAERAGIKSSVTVNISTNHGTIIIGQNVQKEVQHLSELQKLSKELQYTVKETQIFHTPSEEELLEKIQEIKEQIDKEIKK